jgi:iron-sulfur cluster assembly protein
LTENAAKEIKRIIGEQNLPETVALRLGVAGGGCSGFEYRLGFDETVDEKQDAVRETHGIRVAVDKKSELYLDGTEIDYYAGIEKRGFVFNNPNAVNSCGCGSSFSA